MPIVKHAVIAGVLFDFMGWLTSRQERLVLSSSDEASPAVKVIEEFAIMRGLSLDDAKVKNWQDMTAPPKPEQEKESAPQNADPRLLLGRKDNCTALAQPEQEPVNTMPTKIFGPNLEEILNAAGFYRREWVGLTEDEIKKIMQRWRNVYIDIKDVEQLLKEKNT